MVFTNRSAPHRPQLRRCEVTHTHTHALDEGRGEVGESLSTRQACSLTERNAPRSSRFSRSLSLDLHHCALAPRGSIHSRSLSPLSLSLPRSLSLSSLSLSRGRHSIPLPLLPDHSHSLLSKGYPASSPFQSNRSLAPTELPLFLPSRPADGRAAATSAAASSSSDGHLHQSRSNATRPATPRRRARPRLQTTAQTAPPDDASDQTRPDETQS